MGSQEIHEVKEVIESLTCCGVFFRLPALLLGCAMIYGLMHDFQIVRRNRDDG